MPVVLVEICGEELVGAMEAVVTFEMFGIPEIRGATGSEASRAPTAALFSRTR
jgi:hypothetical protein